VGTLIDSHIIPAWMYRRSARFYPEAGTNPVHAGGGYSILDPSQLTDYLLCQGCEDVFRPWETYLSEVSLQVDDSFPAPLSFLTATGGRAEPTRQR
jgi:hypothetical protein